MDELIISARHTTISVLKALCMCVRVSVWLCLFVFFVRVTLHSWFIQVTASMWQMRENAGDVSCRSIMGKHTFDCQWIGLQISVIEHCVKYLSFYPKTNNFT